MDVAEMRFCWLLKQRGYKFWSENELEQKIILKGKRPDFYVETPYGNLLVEIKSLKCPGPLEKRLSNIGSINPKEFLDRLKKSVKEAASQLSPYRDLKIPCLVVLDNYRQIRIPMTHMELIQLFGTIEWRGEINTDKKEIVAIHCFHGGDRRLTDTQHTYVSAVAVNIPKDRSLDDDMKNERLMRLRIVHNPFAICPLPFEIFQDNDDEQYYYQNNKWNKI